MRAFRSQGRDGADAGGGAVQASEGRSWQEASNGTSAAADSASSFAGGPDSAVRPGPVEARTSAALLGDLGLYPRATFLDRVAAFALDCILVAIAVQLLDLHGDGGFPLLLFAYHVGFWGWKGTTLGGIVVGLRVIRTVGGNPRLVDALVRGLASVLSLAALGIGCFWMLQDAERQMWHDKIAGTFVLKVPREVAIQ